MIASQQLVTLIDWNSHGEILYNSSQVKENHGLATFIREEMLVKLDGAP